MLDQDTDRQQAIVIKNISHRWLQDVDEKLGAMRANGGNYDLFASLDIWGYPLVSRITAQLAKIKRRGKLNA